MVFDRHLVAWLRWAGIGTGAVVAIIALYGYMRFTGRPDAAEMRDLGLLLAMELAALPMAFSFLLKRQPPEELPLTTLSTVRVPNPWAY